MWRPKEKCDIPFPLIVERAKRTGTTRAGSLALSLLAAPVNVAILDGLDKRPQSLAALHRAGASPSTTTLQVHLEELVKAGLVERRGRERISRARSFGLTSAGRGLLDVGAALDRWLEDGPQPDARLGNAAAGGAVQALVNAWSADIVRVLAAGPASASELDRVLRGVSLASLEQQLGAMRQAGLIESAPRRCGSSCYQPTSRLRYAIAPLATAADWERLAAAGVASPISRIEVESAFLLATPLVRLPQTLSGTCRLVVEVRSGGDGKQAGVLVTVENGQIVSCVTRMRGQAESWISGQPSAWLRAVIEGKPGNLTAGGSGTVAAAVVGGLHAALFGS